MAEGLGRQAMAVSRARERIQPPKSTREIACVEGVARPCRVDDVHDWSNEFRDDVTVSDARRCRTCRHRDLIRSTSSKFARDLRCARQAGQGAPVVDTRKDEVR